MNIDLLQKSAFSEGLDEQECRLVAELFEVRTLKQGTTVFIENMPGESLYLIERGRVQITKMLAEGDEQVLAVLEPVELFGELAVLDDAPRSATARVLDESTLGKMSRESFELFCQQHPQTGLTLMRNIIRTFSHRVRENHEGFREMVLAGLGRTS